MCLLHSSDKKHLKILTNLETWGDILSDDLQNILKGVMFSLVLICFIEYIWTVLTYFFHLKNEIVFFSSLALANIFQSTLEKVMGLD